MCREKIWGGSLSGPSLYTIDLPYSSISTNTHCIPILPLTKNQNGISSTVGGGFGFSLLADAVDDIWVLTAVTIGVVETAVEATIELGSEWVSRKQERRLGWEEGVVCLSCAMSLDRGLRQSLLRRSGRRWPGLLDSPPDVLFDLALQK